MCWIVGMKGFVRAKRGLDPFMVTRWHSKTIPYFFNFGPIVSRCKTCYVGEFVSNPNNGPVEYLEFRTTFSNPTSEPFKHSACARPSVGKWISCVDIEEDRVLCGGGPHLSLFHLKMTSSSYHPSKFSAATPLRVFESEENLTHNLVKFHEDGFLCAGTQL